MNLLSALISLCSLTPFGSRVSTSFCAHANLEIGGQKKLPILPDFGYDQAKNYLIQAVFSLLKSNKNWSSSPNVNNPNNAWVINFKYGNDNNNKRKNEYPVRLVRAGK